MPILLISLGTSPAIVSEAFLLPGVDFDQVHVLTTESTDLEWVRQWFGERAPGVRLTFTRVAGFRDFVSEEDHFRFEEVLYRWWLEKASDALPHVCISGGFKTMSAAMQKAAGVLGAAEVFHVLADSFCTGPDGKARPPSTLDEIDRALQGNHLHWIRLGPESRWPQFAGESSSHYPLLTGVEEGDVRTVSAPDHRFRTRLNEVTERSHRIADCWDQLGDLPFPDLATWSLADLAWLGEPVNAHLDASWIEGLPKVELHCHLGGFATHGDLLEEVRTAAVKPELLPPLRDCAIPKGWPNAILQQPAERRLQAYMHLGDNNGSALLRDPGCLRRQCQLLYQHLRRQNVLHAEIRCSPANYASNGRSPWTVLSEIREAFDSCMANDPGCHVNLIIIATRRDKGDFRAAISRHLALAVSTAEHWTDGSQCRVVGVDLAGYEDKETRAHYFRDEFTAVHRCGLALTVHAGENDEAEGIWRAVFDLNARRIGHALHLIDSTELMQSMADRGIGVEMCPYANFQIKGYPCLPDATGDPGRPEYPLVQYLKKGIRVSLNTDNIGISAASLTDNLRLAAKLCPGLKRIQILTLISNAVETSFLPPEHRAALRKTLGSLLNSGRPVQSSAEKDSGGGTK